jgi:hypothetical protein
MNGVSPNKLEATLFTDPRRESVIIMWPVVHRRIFADYINLLLPSH